MRRARFALGGAGVLAAALTLACTPPPPPPAVTPQVSPAVPSIVRIDNTPADIAWCWSHPGGAPIWQTEVVDGVVVKFLACKIVP